MILGTVLSHSLTTPRSSKVRVSRWSTPVSKTVSSSALTAGSLWRGARPEVWDPSARTAKSAAAFCAAAEAASTLELPSLDPVSSPIPRLSSHSPRPTAIRPTYTEQHATHDASPGQDLNSSLLGRHYHRIRPVERLMAGFGKARVAHPADTVRPGIVETARVSSTSMLRLISRPKALWRRSSSMIAS